MYEAE